MLSNFFRPLFGKSKETPKPFQLRGGITVFLNLEPVYPTIQATLQLNVIELQRFNVGPAPKFATEETVRQHMVRRKQREAMLDEILLGLRDRLCADLDALDSAR